MTTDPLASLLNAPFTFSANCRSGLADRCECWRCRKQRGEPVTEETERQAEAMAKALDALHAVRMAGFLARLSGERKG